MSHMCASVLKHRMKCLRKHSLVSIIQNALRGRVFIENTSVAGTNRIIYGTFNKKVLVILHRSIEVLQACTTKPSRPGYFVASALLHCQRKASASEPNDHVLHVCGNECCQVGWLPLGSYPGHVSGVCARCVIRESSWVSRDSKYIVAHGRPIL